MEAYLVPKSWGYKETIYFIKRAEKEGIAIIKCLDIGEEPRAMNIADVTFDEFKKWAREKGIVP